MLNTEVELRTFKSEMRLDCLNTVARDGHRKIVYSNVRLLFALKCSANESALLNTHPLTIIIERRVIQFLN